MFSHFWSHPLGRFAIIEIVVFAVAALLSLAINNSYSTGLFITGAVIMALRLGSGANPASSMGEASMSITKCAICKT